MIDLRNALNKKIIPENENLDKVIDIEEKGLDVNKKQKANPAVHDDPADVAEGPLKVLTSGNYRGPSGDQYKKS